MLTRRATLTAAPLAAKGAEVPAPRLRCHRNTVNQNVGSALKDGSNATTNIFAGMTQKQLIAQQSSKEGTFVYTHGLNDRYGNPMVEKIRYDGATAFVEHDPVTGNPLFLRDTDGKSVHMYIYPLGEG